MTEGGFDYWGQRDWLKRIHQLKKELRSVSAEPSLKIPEPTKAFDVKLSSKRVRPSSQQPVLRARSLPTGKRA